MVRNLLLMLCIILPMTDSFGQEKAYINHTEVGLGFGKVKNYNSYDTRINFAAQTFNGVRVNPHHAVGISLGIDTYPTVILAPLSLGWRGIYRPGNRTSPYAAIDLGYGSALLEKREVNERSETWFEGGLMASPAIGIKRNSKNHKYAFTWTLAYKRQLAYFYEGVRATSNIGIESPNLPRGYNSIREESYKFNSLIAKWGLLF